MLKKLLVLVAVGIGCSVFANTVTNELWQSWSTKNFNDVKSKVAEAESAAATFNERDKSNFIIYLVSVKARTKEITEAQIFTLVDEKAKEFGLTDEKYMFKTKATCGRNWWHGYGTDALFEANAKANADKINVWLTEEYSEFYHGNVYRAIIDSAVVLGKTQDAFDFAKKTKFDRILPLAQKLGNDKIIEAANYLLFESGVTLTAEQVYDTVSYVIDKCYSTKYDAAVKEFLTNADNKYYKNLGESAEWKKACTVIQLGLKRFNK